MWSWVVCEKCGKRDTTTHKTPTFEKERWKLALPDITNGLTCRHHSMWQQQCALQPTAIENPIDVVTGEQRDFKAAEVYVSPEARHWPVYDTTTVPPQYTDARNYVDETLDDDVRESMLKLTKEEVRFLAPVRIFMDLKQERGKVTQVGLILSNLSIDLIGMWLC